MRGLRRKDIEKYVDAVFPMLSKTPIYRLKPSGQIVLGPECRRGLVQRIKRNYGKKRRGEL
jgi:hypothetical protein